jgi:hypothetical protein
MAESWLDEWERFVQCQPADKQKLFLSSQTSQGLRVTLRSTRELTSQLLNEGFSYVLTGGFNQDPLEVSNLNTIYNKYIGCRYHNINYGGYC